MSRSLVNAISAKFEWNSRRRIYQLAWHASLSGRRPEARRIEKGKILLDLNERVNYLAIEILKPNTRYIFYQGGVDLVDLDLDFTSRRPRVFLGRMNVRLKTRTFVDADFAISGFRESRFRLQQKEQQQ